MHSCARLSFFRSAVCRERCQEMEVQGGEVWRVGGGGGGERANPLKDEPEGISTNAGGSDADTTHAQNLVH